MTRARPRRLAAASKGMTRPGGSPAFVIRPEISVLPDCHLRGISPVPAPRSLLSGKRSGSLTALRKVGATITLTPTPGVAIGSRVTGLDFASATNWLSRQARSPKSRHRARNMASTMPSRTALPSASLRARVSRVFASPIPSSARRSSARCAFSVAHRGRVARRRNPARDPQWSPGRPDRRPDAVAMPADVKPGRMGKDDTITTCRS